ncbi:ABC transporter permease subunit [Lactobacillus sp. LC28-10]|uniref:ABC transporter permease subunit n=1 Tax=Secundilactobacillus angelensis TaxID=2722706 RepID=A0ABX1KTT1_9LACO|nr:ABC transporter permease subunit [Secundilactobacillus angelensis]MCH5461838.1 ABC transporter permease subunit [Secundilactobacillus angelensis]NLR17326.1 ABC transporter permease subunit [Secundilactobacillus angelensis]
MNSDVQQVNNFFNNKRFRLSVILVILGLAYLGASIGLGFQTRSLLNVQNGVIWLIQNFIPNEASKGYWNEIIKQLFRTFLVAVASTTCAAVASLFLSIIGAKTLTPAITISWVIRAFSSLLRNIPIVAWAMILLFSFKQNDLTGFLALFFMTLGFLTRAFMETIEDFGTEKIQALQATGATYLQVIFQGLLPEVAVALMSWVLYMIENNVRDATLVGLLTGTGIGFIFNLYFKSLRYGAAGLVVLSVIILVVAVELISNLIGRLLS